MRLTSSCTEISTRPIPAHVCTTDGLPRKKRLPDLARSPTHRRPGLPINTVGHRSNMTFLPEGCYPTTSASVFSLSPSLSCPHNLLNITPIPLQPTFLHYLGYIPHPRCPSSSFIPKSVHLGDSTHPSSFRPHPTCLLLHNCT